MTGAGWALFLLPPQLVAWDGQDAPTWALSADSLPVYGLVRELDGAGGLELYAWAGVLLVPAWLLIGWPLLGYGRLPGLVGVLFLLGAPVSVTSYLAEGAPDPWHSLWGAEIFVLLAIPLAAIPAAISARSRHFPPWWWALLACTLLVAVTSTAAFGYFPHGTLIGLGVEVGALALLPTAPRPRGWRLATSCA
ncbi:MAG: hypothetical protein ABF306_13700 [Nocardioides marinisabuli]|uniref:hypothetical protein n=1 Tax=Nocardioides marinisabuli TaxID=419476 RepID=UPI00321BFEB1